MLRHTPPPQRYWNDLSLAFFLIETYISIEKGTCDESILSKLSLQSMNDQLYNDPADFLRYRVYPRIMARVQRTCGTNLNDDELDQFFHKLVMNRDTLKLYSYIAALACIHGSVAVPVNIIYQV